MFESVLRGPSAAKGTEPKDSEQVLCSNGVYTTNSAEPLREAIMCDSLCFDVVILLQNFRSYAEF